MLALALCVAARAADPGYPLLGAAAPDFALHAIGGSNVRLSEHQGEVVVLSFWSSRCAQCRVQLAALDRSLKTYGTAGLSVYGIDVDDDVSRALGFAQSESLGFALLLDPDKSTSRRYRVDDLPMTVLIDRSGVVRGVFRDADATSEAGYLVKLRALLNE